VTTVNRDWLRIGGFCLWVGLILIGSFIRVPEMKGLDKLHPDLIFHSAMYVVLAILGVLAFDWWALIPCIVIAGGTEVVQHFLPYREMSALDFGVDLGGVALGSAIMTIVLLVRRDRHMRADSIAEREN